MSEKGKVIHIYLPAEQAARMANLLTKHSSVKPKHILCRGMWHLEQNPPAEVEDYEK